MTLLTHPASIPCLRLRRSIPAPARYGFCSERVMTSLAPASTVQSQVSPQIAHVAPRREPEDDPRQLRAWSPRSSVAASGHNRVVARPASTSLGRYARLAQVRPIHHEPIPDNSPVTRSPTCAMQDIEQAPDLVTAIYREWGESDVASFKQRLAANFELQAPGYLPWAAGSTGSNMRNCCRVSPPSWISRGCATRALPPKADTSSPSSTSACAEPIKRSDLGALGRRGRESDAAKGRRFRPESTARQARVGRVAAEQPAACTPSRLFWTDRLNSASPAKPSRRSSSKQAKFSTRTR